MWLHIFIKNGSTFKCMHLIPNTRTMASNFLVVKMFSNLFFPRERKSPPLPLQFAFGWAMSNFGQDTTREGQELLFCEQNVHNEWYSELKKRYLEVDNAFGVATIHLPMLGLVANTLVWPNVNNLKIDALESSIRSINENVSTNSQKVALIENERL